MLDLAINGELKDTAIKEDLTTVLQFFNEAVLEIYKTFPIKTNEVVYELDPAQILYTLPLDCMSLLEAYGINASKEPSETISISINDSNNPLSIYTVSWDKVQIPLTLPVTHVSIVYIAAPKTYTIDDLDCSAPFPPQALEAVLLFMGYKAHSSITNDPASESNTYYQMFTREMARLRSDGLFTAESLDMSDRIKSKGFI